MRISNDCEAGVAAPLVAVEQDDRRRIGRCAGDCDAHGVRNPETLIPIPGA
jgi:hypothetical protein